MDTIAIRPNLSVVIPIYNVADYLPDCLDSMVSQTLQNIEVILIDDGSTDASSAIAQQYAEQYSFIQYHRTENRGLSPARNYGVSLATGRYLIFMDSDDLIAPDAYQRMFDLAESYGHDMVCCNAMRFTETRQWVSGSFLAAHEAGTLENTTLAEHPELTYDPTPWNKLYRMEFWKDNGFEFPPIMYEDVPVSIQVYSKAKSIGVLADVFYMWRLRSGEKKSITTDFSNPKMYLDKLTSFAMAFDFWQKLNGSAPVKAVLDRKLLVLDGYYILQHIIETVPEARREIMEQLLSLIEKYGVDTTLLQKERTHLRYCYELLLQKEFDTLVYAAKGKKVSVVIPVYNASNTIEACLDSLLAQKTSTFDVLCVDDGSTDDSAGIIRRYSGEHPFIRLVQQENRGAGEARNTGLERVNGKYVLFLDADDTFSPSLLSQLYKQADRTESDVTVCNAKKIDHTSGETLPGGFLHGPFPEEETFNARSFPERIFSFTSNEVWNKLFRRQFLLDNGIRFQPIRHINDTAFTTVAMTAAERISILNKKLVNYHVNRSGSLLSTYHEQPEAMAESFAFAYGELNKRGLLTNELLKKKFLERAVTNSLSVLNRLPDAEHFTAAYNALKNAAFFADLTDTVDEESPLYSKCEQIRQLTAGEFLVQKYLSSLQLEKDIAEERARAEKDIAAERAKSEKALADEKAKTEKEKARALSLEKELNKQKKDNEKKQKELDRLRASLSFRLGKALLFIPRRLKALLKKQFKRK